MSTAPTLPLGTPEPLTMGEVLRVPVMRRLWYAQLVSAFGDYLALFAVLNFLTFQRDAGPAAVTGLQIAYLLPIAVLGVLAGVFVDRWPLKPTLVSSDLARAALCLLLLFAGSTLQFYAVLAAISVVSSFFGPAQGVAIRSAVPVHGLRSANSLMQQVMFGMRVVGPPLAGSMYVWFGARTCYAGDAVSFLLSGLLIASLALTKPFVEELSGTPTPAKKAGLASIWPDMREGLGFILHHRALLFVILALASGMFILGCFGPLIALYVRDTLKSSTRLYSVVSAMIGVGMFLGVNALNTAGKKISNTTLVYAGLGGIGAGLCLLWGIPHIWGAVLANFIIGFAVAGIVVPANVMIQSETPRALMGRVGSTVMSLIMSAQIAGLLLSGVLAVHIGVRNVFAVCAGLMLLLITAGKLFMEPKAAGPDPIVA